MREFILLKAKYIKRWRGSDGKWRYKYPKSTEGKAARTVVDDSRYENPETYMGGSTGFSRFLEVEADFPFTRSNYERNAEYMSMIRDRLGEDQTKISAHDMYTSHMYRPMNARLRYGDNFKRARGVGHTNGESIDRFNDALYRAIDSGKFKLKNPVQVLRAMKIPREQIAKLGVGDVFVDKGFLSTSLDGSTVTSFSQGKEGRDLVMFNIVAPKGQKYIPGNLGESELIFNAGTKLEITDFDRIGDVVLVGARIV